MLKEGRNLPWRAVIKAKGPDHRRKGTPGRPSLEALPVYKQKKLHAEDRLVNNRVDVNKPKRVKKAPIDYEARVFQYLTKHAYSTLRLIAKGIGKGVGSTRTLLHALLKEQKLFCTTCGNCVGVFFSLKKELLPKTTRLKATPKKQPPLVSVKAEDCKKDVSAYLGIHPNSTSIAIGLFLRVNTRRTHTILVNLEKKGLITRAYTKDRPDVLWSLLTP